jgi:predicted transcriptional regulator
MSKPRKITPTQHLELLAWKEARKKLGTVKDKARELGITPGGVSYYLARRPKESAVPLREGA